MLVRICENLLILAVWVNFKAGFVGAEDCASGLYGSDCNQPCHCHGGFPCDSVSGFCHGSNGFCQPGYMSSTGTNLNDCQVFQGCFQNCTKTCHCSNGAEDCDETAGQCGCQNAWAGTSCQIGIFDFQAIGKSNPGQSIVFTCAASLDKEPPKPQIIWMTKNVLNGPRILHTSSDTKNAHGQVIIRNEFRIASALPQDVYFCRLDLDGITPFAEARAQLYELPTLTNRPRITKTTPSTITLSWQAWGISPTDTGDGPIIEYRVYYTNSIFTENIQWTLADTLISSWNKTLYETTIRGLQPGFYQLYVSAVREEGAEGPPSLTAEAITLLLTTADSIGTVTATSGHSVPHTTSGHATGSISSILSTIERGTVSATTEADSQYLQSTSAMASEMLRVTKYVTNAMPDKIPLFVGGAVHVLVIEVNAVQIGWRAMTSMSPMEDVIQYLIFYQITSERDSDTQPAVIHVDGSQKSVRIDNLIHDTSYSVRVDATTNSRYMSIGSVTFLTPAVICNRDNTLTQVLSVVIGVLGLLIICVIAVFIRCRYYAPKECDTSLPYADNSYAYVNKLALDDLSISQQATVMPSLSETTIISCPESVYESLDDVKCAKNVIADDKRHDEFEKVPPHNPEYHVLER